MLNCWDFVQLFSVQFKQCSIVGTFRRALSDSAPGEMRPPCPPSLRPDCTLDYDS